MFGNLLIYLVCISTLYFPIEFFFGLNMRFAVKN